MLEFNFCLMFSIQIGISIKKVFMFQNIDSMDYASFLHSRNFHSKKVNSILNRQLCEFRPFSAIAKNQFNVNMLIAADHCE